MPRFRIQLSGAVSEVVVARGGYRTLQNHLVEAGLRPPFLIVSQPGILAALDSAPIVDHPVVMLPDGERAKTLRTVSRLVDRMVDLGMGREATVIALGGGVVGDVAGFAASIYLRGVAVVQVPTTLLAQVDSSVGGKTGVNHKAGKNLIGAFHQPALVVADPLLLATLPDREYRSGLFEALKYGVIRDPALFQSFRDEAEAFARRDPEALERLVFRCLRIKADVVEADERESGLRRILNFGHTIGHAIEAAARYRGIRHGEAVGWGMIAASRISEQLGRIVADEAREVERAVVAIGRLPPLGSLSTDALMDAMQHDKKIRDGRIHFVLPRRVGEVETASDVPAELVRSVIEGLG